MREFKDNEGRPWRLALTVAGVLRVRDMVTVTVDELNAEGQPTGAKITKQLDLGDVGTITQTLQVIRNHYATVGEVLYAILVAQVEERKLTKDEFLEGLRGDALDASVTVLEQELVDFFPLRLRKMIGLLAAKMSEVTGELLDQAEAGLQNMTASALPGKPSGKPQESLAFTQENGPSDSSSSPAQPALSTIGGTPQT